MGDTPGAISGRKAEFLLRCCGLAVVLFALFFSTRILAEEEKEQDVYEFGYVEQAPHSFTNAQGQPDGYYVRFITVLFARAGIRWRATSYPANRLFQNLNNGTTQFSILTRVPALGTGCLYSQRDLGGTDIRAYYIGDKIPVENREGLIGQNVIAMRGYGYSGMIEFLKDEKNNINISYAGSNADALDMLVAGRGDYLLHYAGALKAPLRENPVANLHYRVIGRVNRYLVVSRTLPEAEKVMAQLEGIVKTMNIDEFFKPLEKSD